MIFQKVGAILDLRELYILSQPTNGMYYLFGRTLFNDLLSQLIAY